MSTEAMVLPDPDAGNYGPYMRALRPRQRDFIDALLRQARIDHTAAARTAGYSDNNITACAYRLAHDDKVLLALKEETERRLQSHAHLGANVILDLAQNATKDSDRLKAASMLLNRIGLLEILRHESTTTHIVLTADQARARLMAYAKDPDMRALIPPDLIQDVEFVEVV